MTKNDVYKSILSLIKSLRKMDNLSLDERKMLDDFSKNIIFFLFKEDDLDTILSYKGEDKGVQEDYPRDVQPTPVVAPIPVPVGVQQPSAKPGIRTASSSISDILKDINNKNTPPFLHSDNSDSSQPDDLSNPATPDNPSNSDNTSQSNNPSNSNNPSLVRVTPNREVTPNNMRTAKDNGRTAPNNIGATTNNGGTPLNNGRTTSINGGATIDDEAQPDLDIWAMSEDEVQPDAGFGEQDNLSHSMDRTNSDEDNKNGWGNISEEEDKARSNEMNDLLKLINGGGSTNDTGSRQDKVDAPASSFPKQNVQSSPVNSEGFNEKPSTNSFFVAPVSIDEDNDDMDEDTLDYEETNPDLGRTNPDEGETNHDYERASTDYGETNPDYGEMNPNYGETLTSEGLDNNDEEADEDEAEEEEVSPFAISENDEMSDIPSDKWDKLSHSDDVEEQSVFLDDIPQNIGNGVPNIILSDTADIFVEEYEKDISDFVYQRSIISVESPNGKSDRMICTIFPFTPAQEDPNMKILVVCEWGNEFFEASSYENETEGSNMVRLQVGAHELLFQGGMKDWKFGARILPVGLSASAGEKVEELEKEINNPYYTRIKNGHVKFSYDAAPGVQGTVEVFAVKTANNRHKLILVRRIEDFTDYAYPEEQAFVIRTDKNNCVVAVENRMGKVKAALKPHSY